MADWRAIDRRITRSWDVAQLSTVGKLLFTWGIVCADNWGILEDDAGAIKLEIMAGVKCSRQQIEGQLELMESRGMIWRYRPDGHGPLLQFRNFDDWQPKELIRKRGRPKYPVHSDWQPRDDIEGQRIPEKAGTFQNIPEVRHQNREREKTIDKREREQQQTDENVDADESLHLTKLNLLDCLGIKNPNAKTLAALPHVTPEYLRSWCDWLDSGKGEKFKNVQGYLVKRIRAGDCP